MAKLLVVDDEELNREVFKDILEDAGHEVIPARDGREAISFLVASQDFALVLSDIDMPRVNGFDLTRWIHKNHPSTPVILMSGLQDRLPADLVTKSLRLLSKPMPRETLLRIVELVLAGK